VPTDLSHLFAAARADANRVLLAPAEALRRRADRRARLRALGIACGAVAAVLLVVGVSFAAVGARTGPPFPPAATSPVVTPSGPPSPSSFPSSSPTSPPSQPSSPPQTVRTCTSTDLVFVSSSSGVATGNTLDTYTLRSNSSATCQLSGSPVVTYVGSGGTAVPLPASSSTPADSVTLQPGGTAKFWIERPSQGAGNITSGPTCVNNGVYRNLAIRFLDGTSLPLGGHSLTVWCGEISIGDWMVD
jgi:Protein of unknown function (DUF4232)